MDRGILTETPAILVFIAETFPEGHLAPLDDAFALAQVQAFNSHLCSTVYVAPCTPRARLSLGGRGRCRRDSGDAEESAAISRRVLRSDRARDVCRSWVMGTRYTICDPYLFTLARWMEADGVGLVDPLESLRPGFLDHE